MKATEFLAELHPGRTIAEDVLKPLGMSVNALAGELHVPATRLNEIMRGRRGVTADTALRQARYLGVGSEEARLRANHRPPLKLRVRFSRMQLSRRHPFRRRQQ